SEHRKRQVVRRDLCRWHYLLAAELLRLGEVSLGIAHLDVKRDVAWPPVRAPADPATDAALGRTHEAVVHRRVAFVDPPIEELPVEAAQLCPISADDFEPNCWVCQFRTSFNSRDQLVTCSIGDHRGTCQEAERPALTLGRWSTIRCSEPWPTRLGDCC